MKDYQFTPPHGGNESQGWALLSVCWAFVTVASITTLLRVFIRTKLTHNFGADDTVMVMCLVCPSILSPLPSAPLSVNTIRGRS